MPRSRPRSAVGGILGRAVGILGAEVLIGLALQTDRHYRTAITVLGFPGSSLGSALQHPNSRPSASSSCGVSQERTPVYDDVYGILPPVGPLAAVIGGVEIAHGSANHSFRRDRAMTQDSPGGVRFERGSDV